MIRNLKLLLLIAIVLSGCDSNNSVEESNGVVTPDTSRSISGKVIDGEISGATVFLDLNRNGNLDSDEPTASSDGNGTFQLILTTEHRLHQNYINKKAPIVVYGGIDIRTGEAFEDYLTAILEDENTTNVTPITTLIAETLGEELDNDTNNTLTDIDEKIKEIKANLANLLNINQELLTKDPIELAKQGNISLLDNSLQMHKVAKKMKQAMNSELKNLRRSILKNYRAIGKSLQNLKKSAIKEGDTTLVSALDSTFDDNALFDTNLVENVKQESQELSRNISNYWQRADLRLSDSDITNAIKDIEVTIVAPNNEIDTTKPLISLRGQATVTILQGETYSDAGATAIDNKDGDITANIRVTNPVDVHTIGSYTITYNVQDTAGNLAETVSRTVSVFSAPEKPNITTLPATTVNDITNVLINGTAGSLVFVNGIEVGMVGNNGTVTVELNTSGIDGNKNFSIALRDNEGNSSETLDITIERISITRAQAIKFLRQASFRTNEIEIAYVMGNGYEAWINNQFSMVGDLDNNTDTKYGYLESTLRTMNRYNPEYPLSVAIDPTTLDEGVIDGQRMDVFRNSVFWDKALNDENQLRQRITYALSQILVVADESPVGKALSFRGESVINYYDILYKHSFGNYRNLLTDVTHSSAMGYFLTYIGSKAEAPDENYARELTQLFTVGLYELNDDGTKQLSQGNPTPSYNQRHVSDLSKVFTGWGLDDLQGTDPRYGSTGKTDFSWVSPLKFFSEYHDNNSSLNLLGTETMSTSPDGNIDIENALDILFANHNVAPFISRHLIMRLVTSNPTPAYIARVTAKFNNNGEGVKGDLKAVVKAILLDPEARGKTTVNNFGKVDEMIVSYAHFMSQFKAKPAPKMSVRVRVSLGVYENRNVTDMYWINPQREFGQTVLGAPSVFNFYSNEFIPSSSYFAQNSLVAPELELQTIPNLIGYSNLLDTILTVKEKYAVLDLDTLIFGEVRYPTITDWAEIAPLSMSNQALYLDLTEEYNVFEKALDNETVANGDFSNMGDGTGANTDRTRAVNALLEHLDDKLFGGTMPQTYKDALLLHTESLNYLANNRNRASRARAIVTTLVRGIITSSLFMVLK